MFLIIPLIIIFLLSSYLFMNETTIYTQIFVYILIFITIFISSFIYKSIKKNMKQQELNTIQLEINEYLKKIQNSTDEKYIQSLKHKIEVLTKEIKTKSN